METKIENYKKIFKDNILSQNLTNKLIKEITELFISDDDDTDGAMDIVLDKIEKFRQEIKNKYRMYLQEQELKTMSSKLKLLQKEAKTRKEELINYQFENAIGRSR